MNHSCTSKVVGFSRETSQKEEFLLEVVAAVLPGG